MTNDIKDCRRDFAEDINFLRDILDGDAPIETKVEAASILWDLSEQAKAALDPFKVHLRELARESGCSPGKAFKCYSVDKRIEASVVVPSPRLSLRNGVDIEDLRDAASFADFVEEITTFKVRRGIDAAFKDLDDGDRATWLDAIKINTPTPRVSFSRTTMTTNQKEV